MTTPLAPITARPGLSPYRATLDNGLVVIAKQTRKTPAVTISLAIRAGSVCDPADAPGAMHLLAKVVDRGTARRTAADIAEEIDSRGLSLSVTVTRHLLSIAATCLASDFDEVFALLGDIVTEASLPEGELATRKGEVVTALKQDEDNPAVRASEGLMALLYGGDHPYGRPVKGTIAAVEAMARDRLAALYRSRFAPSELSVVVVGDTDPLRVVDVAGRVFKAWTAPRPPAVALSHPPAASERRRVVIPMMNKAQADVAYGFTAITRSDPAYYAYWLMNVALGQYALGGRLGDNIRERQGMAYYVGSSLDANVIEGPLQIRAGISPANVDRAIAAIDDELTALRRDGLTEKELRESRQWVVGSMPRALETNPGIAHFLQTVEHFGLGLDYDQRMPALLGAVTLDQVHEAARQVLDPSRATIVIAGPYSPGA
jgi:zinc protease